MPDTDRPMPPEPGASPPGTPTSGEPTAGSPTSAPTGSSGAIGLRLVRRSRALPIALLASVVGLVLCGVTYAVAGETVHTRDIDLIDPLPAGVVTISNDVVCATVPGSENEQCRRRVAVRRDGTPADVLAEELSVLYRDRGFDLNAVVAGNGRTYFGSFGGPCGPQLFVGGTQLTGFDPNAQPGGLSDADPEETTTTASSDATTTDATTGDATTTTDPSAIDPDLTAPTTAIAPAADGSGEPIVSSPPEPGAPGEGPVPFQATPDETTPDETTPTETVPVQTSTSVPAVAESNPVAPPSIVRQPPSVPAGRGATTSSSSDIVTIEISEPYPGLC